MTWKYSLFLCLVFIGLHTSLLAQDRISGPVHVTRSEVIAKNGMACTSQPLATQVAIDILKKGGTAIDAAIAANATLGLMEPTGCGIGGDLFAIVWDAETEQLYGLNASGRSPKNLTLSYFQENGMSKIPAYGPLPVSVPGAVDGWFELHGKFGKLAMEEVLAPAISYAEEGFPVSELISYYMHAAIPNFLDLGFPNVAETYTNNGEPYDKGQIFKNPFLANTYRSLAKGGRDAFYKGDIARTIASFIQEQGGFLSYEDLASHRSEWVDPVSTNYRGYDVWELPPNGQGIAALQMLNILEPYDLASMGFDSPEYIHTFVEAKKLAFEDRAKYYADMDFANVPVEQLISKEYGKQRAEQINPDEASVYEAGQISAGETIYLTVADQYGNMISLIQSNYRGMGSGMVPPKLGFMLQDRGELFSLTEGQANTYEPGKRPFHTIIPAFVTRDGAPWLSFGVMGGDYQPLGQARVISNLFDHGLDLQGVLDAPRVFPLGDVVEVEHSVPTDVLRGLMGKGHTLRLAEDPLGGAQAIRIDHARGTLVGASDPRKDGYVAGY